MRGAQRRVPPVHHCVRITPARTGNADRRTSWCPRRPDHPRVCSESTPLRRPMVMLSAPPPMDHPRVCGEHGTGTPTAGNWLGLPPRVRRRPVHRVTRRRHRGDHPRECGERRHPVRRVSDLGITPARAGRTITPAQVTPSHSGSPPLARGAPLPELPPGLHRGITPARAGKASLGPLPGSACRDHPRMCGEHPPNVLSWKNAYGSPPRIRGALLVGDWHVLAPRITPACTGRVGLVNWGEASGRTRKACLARCLC